MAKELKNLTKRAENYSQWYNDLVMKADLAELSPVRGCMIIKPYGYAIWEKMQQELDKIEAQGEQLVKLALQEGTAYRTLKQAEADLYTRKKEAEADLLVKLAEAQRTELRNAAMEQAGSDRMVALRMAEVLKGLETIVLPTGGADSLNPLDLAGMLKTFGLSLDAPAPVAR